MYCIIFGSSAQGELANMMLATFWISSERDMVCGISRITPLFKYGIIAIKDKSIILWKNARQLLFQQTRYLSKICERFFCSIYRRGQPKHLSSL